SVSLLGGGGVLSLLLPVKLWRSLAGGGVRAFLLRRATLLRLEDLSRSTHAFDAAVYPSLLVARAGQTPAPAVDVCVHADDAAHEWQIPSSEVAFDASPGAPWIMLQPDARAAFDRVRAAGIPLTESLFGAPRLGVKSGCNSAFIVRVVDVDRDLARVVSADGESGLIEAGMLRPALRGESIEPWTRRACRESILWTHDASGAPLPKLPDRARAWLRRHQG